MMHANPSLPDPISNRERLQEIADLDLFSPATRSALQGFTEQAAQRLRLPISLVSIVLNDAQQFAASCGLSGWLEEVGGTPIEWSFCVHAVRSREPFVVEDAATHPLVKENPLVIQGGVRCYAGVPLISTRGHALGALCVIGTEASSPSAADMAELKSLADQVMHHLEQSRASRAA